METTKLTLEDLKDCIEIVLSGGEVELFLPEKEGGDIFRRVELRDYAETLLQGVVPVIYEKRVPRVMPGKTKETVKKELEQVKKEMAQKAPGKSKKEPEQPVDRGKIIALAKAGWSDLKIAKEMNLPVEEIRRQQEAVNA